MIAVHLKFANLHIPYKYKKVMKKNKKSISFIVPFFNEYQNLNKTFDTIKKLIGFYSILN